jgi:hypothetical protein
MGLGEGLAQKLPRFVSIEWERFGTPIPATFISAGFCLILALFSFELLIQLEM